MEWGTNQRGYIAGFLKAYLYFVRGIRGRKGNGGLKEGGLKKKKVKKKPRIKTVGKGSKGGLEKPKGDIEN